MIVRISLDNNCSCDARYYVLNQQIVIDKLGKGMAGNLEFPGGNKHPDMVKKTHSRRRINDFEWLLSHMANML